MNLFPVGSRPGGRRSGRPLELWRSAADKSLFLNTSGCCAGRERVTWTRGLHIAAHCLFSDGQGTIISWGTCWLFCARAWRATQSLGSWCARQQDDATVKGHDLRFQPQLHGTYARHLPGSRRRYRFLSVTLALAGKTTELIFSKHGASMDGQLVALTCAASSIHT